VSSNMRDEIYPNSTRSLIVQISEEPADSQMSF
jgi:hypothetical protein